MARYCFYCNRELAPGESCQCRVQARENLRRQKASAEEPQTTNTNSQQSNNRYRAYQQQHYQHNTSGASSAYGAKQQTKSRKHRWTRSKISWSSMRPQVQDFLQPLDSLDNERPYLANSIIWLAISLLLQGLFFFLATGRLAYFPVGIVFGMVSLGVFLLVLFLHFRFRQRQKLTFQAIFARSRPVFLYASLFFLLAAFTVRGNLAYGQGLLNLGLLATKGGLLWQLRHQSPLERNQYLWLAVLAFLVDAMVTGPFLQSLLYFR